MFKKIDKHMPAQKENPAEHMKPSKEGKFPKLTEHYWANPSDGIVQRCSENAGIKEYSKHKEGL